MLILQDAIPNKNTYDKPSLTEGLFLYYNSLMLTYLIPTAKEMTTPERAFKCPLPEKSKPILAALLSLSEEELAKAYHLKEEATLKEIERLQKIADASASSYFAYQLFNGLMYRYIERTDLSQEEENYLFEHVYITSSLYGVIPFNHKIAKHRLDFHTKVKVNGRSLKQYWRQDYDRFVTEDKVIVSLLSSEFEEVFSTDVKKLWISVRFMEEKAGQLKTHSTISKKARGSFLTAAMKANCQSIENLKSLDFKGFRFHPELSDKQTLTYIKKET
ncbi:peroxide stress protein YaaA [Streptococcus iniae]|nr:peroxide stress protein YaaA [Streptococcus iniae]